MGDTHVGLQARLMSQAMRKLAGTLSRFDTSAIFINQLREKIGVMFGSPETTPGGRALKFYSSVRLDVRKIENLKDGTDVVGSRTRVKVVKNKVAPPFRQCEFDIMYGKGISKEGSLIDVGVEQEIIKKAGAWFTYEGDQLGQGRENAKQFLAEHVDVRDEIERKVREAVGLTSFGAEGDETPIQVVPDLVLEDREPEPATAAAGRQAVEGAQRRRLARGWTPGVPADPRTRRAATSAPSVCWPCARAAGGSWNGDCSRPGSRRTRSPTSWSASNGSGLIDDEAFARQVAEHAFGVKRAGKTSRHGHADGRRGAAGHHRGDPGGCGRRGRARRGPRPVQSVAARLGGPGQGLLAADIPAGQAGLQPRGGPAGGPTGPGHRPGGGDRGPRQPCLRVHTAVAS